MKWQDLTCKTETDKVLQSLIERYFLSKANSKDPCDSKDKRIELFLKASCGSNCSYCYLHRFRTKLYPMDLEQDELILSNLSAFLDLYIENKLDNNFELFSGRIFDTQFGIDVLELIYNKFKNSNFKPREIVCPDDMQFLLYPEQVEKIEYWLDKLNSIGIILHFSASVDGRIIDYHRFGDKVDYFYKTLKEFCDKHRICYHPMVSKHAIHQWIENFDWWWDYLDGDIIPLMLLEVRNGDWDKESYVHYLKLLNHIFDKLWGQFSTIKSPETAQREKELFIRKLTGDVKNDWIDLDIFSFRKMIELKPISSSERFCCAIQSVLHLRMADLAVVPCHRTGYSSYVVGKFVKNENNEICGIESNNVPIELFILNSTLENIPKCHNCPIKHTCMGPCLGANFEETSELFYTPDSVCKLFKLNNMFIVKKLQDCGFLDFILKRAYEKTVSTGIRQIIEESQRMLDNKEEDYLEILSKVLEEDLLLCHVKMEEEKREEDHPESYEDRSREERSSRPAQIMCS